MKIVATIFGIIGALGALALGFKWYSDLNSELGKAALAIAQAAGDAGGELLAHKNATYALIACGIVGLLVSIMVAAGKGKKVVNAILLIVAAVAPIAFSSDALFGVPMALGGLFAFGAKYKTKDAD